MHLVRAALAIALAVFAGAGVPTAGAAHAGERTVLVFAAASLTDALDAALAAYRPADGIEIRVSYAASSTLARQIERGAPADIFLSAHPEWMDHLAARDLIDRSARQDLVANGLVLVGPDGGDETRLPATLDADYPLRAALGDGRLAMGDPDHVPAGLYAREALEALGHWDALAPRTARAANVRASLA
jgi:molybdate transport system substrate-binding protein